MSTYYICGAISAKTEKEMQANLLKFDRVALELRNLGHEVINPPELDENKKNRALIGTPEWVEEWTGCLHRDLKIIRTRKPTMYVMEGWEMSLGANLELLEAEDLGLTICYQ